MNSKVKKTNVCFKKELKLIIIKNRQFSVIITILRQNMIPELNPHDLLKLFPGKIHTSPSHLN